MPAGRSRALRRRAARAPEYSGGRDRFDAAEKITPGHGRHRSSSVSRPILIVMPGASWSGPYFRSVKSMLPTVRSHAM